MESSTLTHSQTEYLDDHQKMNVSDLIDEGQELVDLARERFPDDPLFFFLEQYVDKIKLSLTENNK